MRVAWVVAALAALAACQTAPSGSDITWTDCAAVERGRWRGFEAETVCVRRRRGD